MVVSQRWPRVLLLGDEGELAGLCDQCSCAVPDFEVFFVESVEEVVGADAAGQPAGGGAVADVDGEFDGGEAGKGPLIPYAGCYAVESW
jgi:hypothetical protein